MKKPPGGYILMVTMITLALASVILGLSLELTSSTYRNASRDLTLQQSQALADGCIEVAFAQWKRYLDRNLKFDNSNPPTGQALAFIHDNPPDQQATLQASFADGNFTLNRNTYNVVALGYDSTNKNSFVLIDPSKVPDKITQSSGTSLAPANIYRYLATAEVTGQARGGPVTARVSRYFELTYSNLVQKAIFFENDLEIFPGAQMNIYGDVHTNANLYAGYDTLGFYQNVASVGDFANAFKTGDSNHSGTPAAPRWENGGKDAQLKTSAQVARQEVLGVAPNTITDDIHKLIEVPTSTSNDADALSNRRLYNQADYRILMNSSSKDIIYDTMNGSVTVPAKGSAVSYARNGNDATAKAISNPLNRVITVSDTTIKDGRQKGPVLLNTIDAGALSATIQTNSGTTQAIVYTADVAYSDSAQTAVRLKNGSALKQDLTIASQNAVYINGDYNTGLLPPRSNTGGSPPLASDVLANNSTYNSFTEGAGYDRFSSMIAADAVTVLSNGWVDANSTSGTRKAAPTTINSAIISGNVATKAGTYSGGVENFPRFLEDWGSIPFTYYGSFIQLYNSKQFTAPWGGTTYYQAPVRRWFFDMQFLTRPAPGVATATAKQRGAWFRNTPAASSL